MKKNFSFYFMLAILAGMTLVFSNCTKEGPAGPAGTAGQNGVDGVNGTDGTDGVDGNALCLECHTLAKMEGIGHSYEMSQHAIGDFVGYAGGRNNCAKCHSHEGFTETLLTGRDTTAANIPIPTAFTCKTCHGSHVSFDPEEGDLTPLNATAPFTLIMDNHTTTIDMGNSNLCAGCHQPRTAAPVADESGMFTITSSHYGPHHGPQSTVLEGIGGFEVGAGYPEPGSDVHRQQSSCLDCHVKYTPDADYGGHKFSAGVGACTTCHPDATDLDINGKQTEITELAEELKGLLMAQGVLDADGHVVPGTYTINQAGAFYNYATVEEDRSKGVHNYEYVKTLLINSIAVMQ